ncbi:hypothetical protein [Palleronia caenipelagi]|uniref:Uncharacterized protein n=1 Tax=Palleronia caenipelagi TaxID=2489174 RepID=A0A547PMZ1_9RHOB|nr:hypothetical protein [Palleronia caenipelagi]TRD15475.1 hypothetical protein FEV53_16300 [Palleronia caenipelagi]
MSGRKCSNVTISSNAYNQLRTNVRRADNAAAAARRQAEKERAKNRAMQAEFRRSQDSMQREYRQGLVSLSDSIRHVELQQNERLNTLRDEMFENFEAQSRAFAQALNEHRAEVSAQLEDIRDEITADKETQRYYAEQRVSDVAKLMALLAKDADTERFAPGELASLEARLEDARNAISLGQHQAAFSGAQERYYDYQELRVKIAERQALWSARLELALRQSERVAGDIAAANEARYQFGEDQQSDVAAEVDFWSWGRLSELKAAHEDIAAQLSNATDLSAEDLERLETELIELEGEIVATVALARERLIQSQHRRDIGEAVLESFEGTIWQLDDNSYEGEDFRRGLHLKMKNEAQEEIVVSITPNETADGGMSSVVEVNFFDRDNDERLRAARLREMQAAMQHQGVEVEGFRCMDNSVGQPGDAKMRDFERLRQPLPAPDNTR